MPNKVEETRQNMEILNTRSGREEINCNFEPHLNIRKGNNPSPCNPGFTNKREKLSRSKNSKSKIIDNRSTGCKK